ncbi:ubiquitin carboxyl-terminal hydrolase-domain-containing protein [Gorgonomyces haynaldii]|nr:ubiquitin carboxyl-terminal hydrolase-domain-containing protein [Gorgonomyces haynaldii]
MLSSANTLFWSYFKLFISDLLVMEHEDLFKYKSWTVTRIEISGLVVERDVGHKSFRFKLNDGTGEIPCILWYSDDERKMFTPPHLELGDYVRLRGRLGFWREERQFICESAVVEEDVNAQLYDWADTLAKQKIYSSFEHQPDTQILQTLNQKKPKVNHDQMVLDRIQTCFGSRSFKYAQVASLDWNIPFKETFQGLVAKGLIWHDPDTELHQLFDEQDLHQRIIRLLKQTAEGASVDELSGSLRDLERYKHLTKPRIERSIKFLLEQSILYGAGVTAAGFDPAENLIWIGGTKGQQTSYIPTGSNLLRYTSFPAHAGGPVRQMIALEIEFGSCFCMNSGSDLLVSSANGKISAMNLMRGTVVKQIDAEPGIVYMKRQRLLATALQSGLVVFRDPASLKIISEIPAHTGGISSMDMSGNYMITTGFSSRNGSLVVDPLIKLYDLRTNKALPPLPCSIGPHLVKFSPLSTDIVFASNALGSIQQLHVSPSEQHHNKFMQADISGYLTTMDISSTSEMLLVGDSYGTFQLWAAHDNAQINQFNKPSEYRDLAPTRHVEIDDDTPLSKIGMPYYTEQLCSVWPPHLKFIVGRPAPPIPQQVLEHVKMVDFVGYAPMPKNMKRNQNLVYHKEHEEHPRFRSEQARERAKGTKNSTVAFDGVGSSENGIPKIYETFEIQYSRFGVEDFDFGYYNTTEFGGLESHIRNSYLNSLLQLFHFIWPLRELAKTHIRSNCLREPCLTCELGFLCRMLETSMGVNCQATNFLRAFSIVPQANALGLLEPEHQDSKASTNYSALIQKCARFILEQVHQDLEPGTSHTFEQLLGIPILSTTLCQADHKTERQTMPFVIDLVFQNKRQKFEEILKSSINRKSTTRAWCSECNKYSMMTQTKELSALPNFMVINANPNTENLSFVSKESWLPKSIGMALRDGELVIVDLEHYHGSDVAIYDLRASIVEAKSNEKPGRLVAHINVSDDPSQSRWLVFNDFCVQTMPEDGHVFQKWKTPCIFEYAKRTHETTSSFFLSPVELDYNILRNNAFLNRRQDLKINFIPLRDHEIPRAAGYLCAIDAEFVAMTKAELELRSDGTKKLLRPSRYSLARVSVVRGEGPDSGVPFIDDYIAMTEPVSDYLTEYSGIKHGDLDPNTSQHPLVSLKVAYKRLRVLIDMGCIFVGHDLRKDCRTINIHIPPSQIIDTVKIFKAKNRQRNLSLRFLAWCLLRQDIQTETHDSIEDATTALKLYLKNDKPQNRVNKRFLSNVLQNTEGYNTMRRHSKTNDKRKKRYSSSDSDHLNKKCKNQEEVVRFESPDAMDIDSPSKNNSRRAKHRRRTKSKDLVVPSSDSPPETTTRFLHRKTPRHRKKEPLRHETDHEADQESAF